MYLVQPFTADPSGSVLLNKSIDRTGRIAYTDCTLNKRETDMGYGIRSGGIGGSIRTFWPDDTDTTMYIQADILPPTLAELLDQIQDRWPGTSAENITITPEKIHTDCLGYDLYDAGDYTDFILITKTNGA